MLRKKRMHEVLINQLNPEVLTLTDESSYHNVASNAETHFKLVAVSAVFRGLSRVARHRLLHQWLLNELKSGLHALTMHLYTPEEWQQQANPGAPHSPACHSSED